MNLDSILPLVRRPSRYCGNEFNIVRKDWQSVDLRIVFAFPDMYEIGMSHLGLPMLYHIINSRSHLLAERVYSPDKDLEDLLREKKEPLFSLESKKPLADFDIIGITLPYELCYTNILTILDLAGIPFRAAERNLDFPLVIGGGPCAFHPEPVADFFDAILLGDGEEAILDLAEAVRVAKSSGQSKEELLEILAAIDGVYVPAFFVPEYNSDNRFCGMRSLKPGYEKVTRRFVADLDAVPYESKPLVPLTKIVHDRLGIEIARGCTRGCRFCQAGIIYRPVRERSPEKIFALAKKGIEEGGFDEIGLLSLSSGDYSCLSPLLVQLMDHFVKDKVSVSMPSLRVGSLTPEMMEQIKRVRKSGFTLAPEAGTDRLRRVINKGITEEDLLETCRAAFSLGWKLIKLYFMFGLPTETEEDLQAIAELARKSLALAGRGAFQINVSAATFVPKPHTPFQWEPQISIAQGWAKIDFLKNRLKGKGLRLKWHDPRQSFLEGVMSRGDRKLSQVIEDVWRAGARFDAWSDYFHLETWFQAATKNNIDLEEYLRRREIDEPLPWQHLDCGVGEDFFRDELEKSLNEIYTPDCRVHGCQTCGLCDFKQVKPVLIDPGGIGQPVITGNAHKSQIVKQPESGKFIYKILYSRTGDARFVGHLEMIQMFFRLFKRLKLPLVFSKGFNPSPKVSFSPALPLGTESLAEHLLVTVAEPLKDKNALLQKLNENLPSGFALQSIELGGKQGDKFEVCYHVKFPKSPDPEPLESFMRQKEFVITLERGGRKKSLDARKLVTSIELTDQDQVRICMTVEASVPSVKPLELLRIILALSNEEMYTAKVMKISSRELT
ncbi:MAG: TIGR03960 family B12-binding radical SAM protein [Proteobacteria bacterium]|nr:TIGR03960 family B12-binding radical SAM protein [Pseudomonadota bacterium]MBU1710989.1 TIGR03960 family B12-binding radical SAM protein [Pseudomonadota bacterium]